MCQTCFFWLKNIRQIRHCLTFNTTRTLVQCYRALTTVTLSTRLPKYQMAKLQLVQNSAMRHITCTSCRGRITPLQMQLHWLPVNKRVRYKLLLSFEALHGQSPSYLRELEKQQLRHSRRRAMHNLIVYGKKL